MSKLNRCSLAAFVLICCLGSDALAQTCDISKRQIVGNVSSGDGSTPCPALWVCAQINSYAGCRSAPPGSVTMTMGSGGNVHYDFYASGCAYFKSPLLPGADCTFDTKTRCESCSGGFDIKLFAQYGNFVGTVYQLPEGNPVGYGVPIAARATTGGLGGTWTLADGSFNFTSGKPDPLYKANNWGIGVGPSDGGGPATLTYLLTATGFYADGTWATTSSSTVTYVDLYRPGGDMLDLEHQNRCPTPKEGQCPLCGIGRPVNVTSGNVYLDQTDAVITGIGAGLVLTRSYNSRNAVNRRLGAFGYGWTHSFESTITVKGNIARLRRGDGVSLYFQDTDGDLRYDPSIPIAQESWIVKSADGSLTRYFRAGGFETYDALGQLSGIADASGNATLLTRDASRRIVTLTMPGPRALVLTYNAAGRVAMVMGPEGLIAGYLYDTAANTLRSVTYADGSGYTFGYDAASGLLLTVGDLSGRILETHTYSGSKGITSEISDGVERYMLDYGTGQTNVTDALGNVTTYSYTQIRGMPYITKISGACTSCSAGNHTQEWTYDRSGRVLTYTDGEGDVTNYAYDANGDLVSKTDLLSNVTTYTHDERGRLLTQSSRDAGTMTYTQGPAGPLTLTDAINRTTTITYSDQGKATSITNALGKTSTLDYDAFGDLRSMTDPLGRTMTFGYDALGRHTTVTDPLNNTTTTTYDVRGHVTRVIAPDGTHTDFGYDQGGRRTSTTDALGRITQYGYDVYGRLSTVSDAMGGVTTYGYDLMSRLTSLTDARGNVTGFTLDAYGRTIAITYPGNLVEAFTYDRAGRLRTKTDRRGTVTTYTYDGLGRVLGKSSGPKSLTRYGYDSAGRLVLANNSHAVLSWSYDLAGQITAARVKKDPCQQDICVERPENVFQLSYAYDLAGNRSAMRIGSTLFATYAYDGAGQLSAIAHGATGFSFAYDDASRRVSLRYPNGIATSYTYDTLSRLTNLDVAPNVTQASYAYDAVSNRLSKTTPEFAESYTYDPLYRLSQVVRGAAITESYTYDLAGNRLTSLDNPSWSYDERNELTANASSNFAYDANGNLISRSEGSATWTYAWDADNQLTRVTRDAAEVARFSYDPLGRRLEKIVSGVTRWYQYDGKDILREVVGGSARNAMGGTVQATYVHGPGIDEPLAIEDASGNPTYLHVDGLGSVVKGTNSAGAVTLARQYDAWGNLQAGSTIPGYAFTGREWDPEIGLFYYRARYYDPRIGRFISEDPLQVDHRVHIELNGYPYSASNPVSRKDPLGLESGAAYQYDYTQTNQAYPPTQTPPGLDNGALSRMWRCTMKCRSILNPPWVPLTNYSWKVLGWMIPEVVWVSPCVGVWTTFTSLTCLNQCVVDPATMPGN